MMARVGAVASLGTHWLAMVGLGRGHIGASGNVSDARDGLAN